MTVSDITAKAIGAQRLAPFAFHAGSGFAFFCELQTRAEPATVGLCIIQTAEKSELRTRAPRP